MPETVQVRLMKDFVYTKFLFNFRKFLDFKMQTQNSHSRYMWDNEIYRNFMFELFDVLEPRREFANTILIEENSEALEVLFL